MSDKKYDILKERRHPSIKNRESINRLLDDSYKGGIEYLNNNHLHRHSLENDTDYKNRKERSYFISHTKEIVDIIVGYLYNYEIKRDIPKEINYITDKINQTQSYNSFIQKTATLSCLYTNAVLIDSPSFDPEIIKTVKDIEDNNIRPYAKRYPIFDIRDVAFNSDGTIKWILLDDSYIDDSDPFVEAREITQYTLWESNTVTKYFYSKDKEGKYSFTREEISEHNLGEVPVILVNFRDVDDDKFSNSFSESLSILDRAIYNYLSLADVTLAKAAIKTLMFPSQNNELPKVLSKSGQLSKMIAIPFDSNSSNKPFLLEPNNNSTDGFINIINILLEEARQSVGLTKEGTVHGISGKAKETELQKMHVILRQGAVNLEELENEIIRLFLKWQRIEKVEYNITYPKKFVAEDTQEMLEQLYSTLTLGSNTLNQESVKQIVKIVHPNLEDSEVTQIVNEISDKNVDFTVTQNNDDNLEE